MNDYTPPIGGPLPRTTEPNPGDRIAGALSSLKRTPGPGWLWELWESANAPGSPLVPRPPHDAAVIGVGEGVGFDTSPPHYGLITREMLLPYGGKAPKGPELFAGHLLKMLATASAPDPCMCGVCIPTGTPPGLVEYLSSEVAAPADWPPSHPDAGRDPGGSIRHTLALEVASARALREHYIHSLHTERAPGGWLEQATDPEYPGHYMARMSDTGLAVGVCSVMWWGPMLTSGLVHLYPVEMYAALAEGFAYPVPFPFSDEWHAQAEAESLDGGQFSCEVLRHTAADLEDILANGRAPWDEGNTGPCEVSP